jgi:hypothetical protein
MEHPNAVTCENCEDPHIIVPLGFYVELYEAVRGKKVEIPIGLVYPKESDAPSHVCADRSKRRASGGREHRAGLVRRPELGRHLSASPRVAHTSPYASVVFGKRPDVEALLADTNLRLSIRETKAMFYAEKVQLFIGVYLSVFAAMKSKPNQIVGGFLYVVSLMCVSLTTVSMVYHLADGRHGLALSTIPAFLLSIYAGWRAFLWKRARS